MKSKLVAEGYADADDPVWFNDRVGGPVRRLRCDLLPLDRGARGRLCDGQAPRQAVLPASTVITVPVMLRA